MDGGREVLAREWHALSDHAADGTPFGGGLCNCMQQAERVATLISEALNRAASYIESTAQEAPNQSVRQGAEWAAAIVRNHAPT